MNTGIANYNALQVQANRRFTHGLQFGVAYTLSQLAGLHLGDRDRHGARAAADLQRRPRLDLRPVVVRSDPRGGHQLHLGPAEGQLAVEQRRDARGARQLAAVGHHGVRQRHAVRRHARAAGFGHRPDRRRRRHARRRHGRSGAVARRALVHAVVRHAASSRGRRAATSATATRTSSGCPA